MNEVAENQYTKCTKRCFTFAKWQRRTATVSCFRQSLRVRPGSKSSAKGGPVSWAILRRPRAPGPRRPRSSRGCSWTRTALSTILAVSGLALPSRRNRRPCRETVAEKGNVSIQLIGLIIGLLATCTVHYASLHKYLIIVSEP